MVTKVGLNKSRNVKCNALFEPGVMLNPRFEKCCCPLCEFIDPDAEYLLFSDVVNEVNVRFAINRNI